MIKPTIGRQVWFFPAMGDPDIEHWDVLQACAATVVYVHTDRLINVVVMDHAGNIVSKRSIALLQDDDVPVKGCQYAMWMPYQKAVAGGQQAATLHANPFGGGGPGVTPRGGGGSSA